MAPKDTPDVFEFLDYREYLRAYYQAGRQNGSGVSLRAFGRRAGLRSPNYLKLVMDGDRNLTCSMAVRFAGAAGLRGADAQYFCDLVAFNQAKTTAERERAYQGMSRFKRYRQVRKLAAAEEAYYSQWYIPAIRELAASPDFRDDPKWIAKTLLPPIAPQAAQRALDTLVELGLLVRDEQSRLVQASACVGTGNGPLGHHVVMYHRAMMERAAEALDYVPREGREIASVTLCLNDSQVQELKSWLQDMRREILDRYSSVEGSVRVVQLNMQMFPLSAGEASP